MKFFLAEAEQKRHYPEFFLVNGVNKPNPEQPERVDRLRAGAIAAGLKEARPKDYGLDPVAAVQAGRYLEFMQSAYRRWARIEGAAPAITPNIHPNRRDFDYPLSVVAQAGFHMLDAGCPIGADTYESSLWSAWTAVAAADEILAGARAAYALCRPPGHHATADAAAGFCYFNNAAIAARRLQKSFPRVAILDVDVHHGNGTQEIFYRSRDVLTVSLHADPKRFYPFFWGHADERGEDAGEGFNLNLPLPRGAGDEDYLAALDIGLDRIADFAPDALIVALGLDASKDDPFAGLAVTTKGFEQIASKIARRFDSPSLLVQEGGYLCDALGANLTAFLTGFQAGRRL
ncbi:MAG: histone deacetylase family protein [Alphaproteobacteria bacterium]|nr:histone deacetylase family protein [Alphaproteobacteria bacterium]